MIITPFQLEVRQYVKAIVGGLGVALGVLAGAAGDGISAQEALTAVGAGLAGFTATFYAPNKAPEGKPDDPALSEQSAL